MRNILLTLVMILFACGCRLKPELHTYSTKTFQIGIPHGWIIKEGEFKFMPINGHLNDSSKGIVPNFNVTLIDPNGKDLKQIVDQNSKNNCLKGTCEHSTTTKIETKTNDCYKSYQEILIGKNRIVIQQYYSIKRNTIYLLSFFCLRRDFVENEKLFEDMFSSFFIK